ncbi:MobA/MobL family protein [Luteibacter anthropi]|uniref:MobA/MobL family protein n=1 Tax=Luteibacter anthropi TaxID=564369 RepID=UPI002032F2DC|nr:MobA/MobL family protein [Luteibacter anthropi]URX62055.1 MobA/MobL family protein [Luteibacter anthropi]
MTDTPTPIKHARPHLTTHSRASGHSSVAGAAYRLGLKLVDHRTGKTHDFRKRKAGDEIVYAITVAPTGAPAWATDPQELWNRVESSEHRKDAQVARDYRVPIPLGLDAQQACKLADELARFISNALNVPVSLGLHRDAEVDALGVAKSPDKVGYHVHLYFPTRILLSSAEVMRSPEGPYGEQAERQAQGEDTQAREGSPSTGFGAKLGMLSNRRSSAKWVESFNQTWAEACNRHLAEAARAPAIDHRSYIRQGLSDIPQPKVGQAATALERKGMSTLRGSLLRSALAVGVAEQRAVEINEEAIRASVGADITARILARRKRFPQQTPSPTQQTFRRPLLVTPGVYPHRPIRTSAPPTSLEAHIRAVARPPKNDAESQALERSVKYALYLEEVIKSALARMDECLALRKQVERVQSTENDLLFRLDVSRADRVRALRKLRSIEARQAFRIRLIRSGLPLQDPRHVHAEDVSRLTDNVRVDEVSLLSLRRQAKAALRRLTRSEHMLQQERDKLKEAAEALLHSSRPAFEQALAFLPEAASALVRDVMNADAAHSIPSSGEATNDGQGSGSDGQAGGVTTGRTMRERKSTWVSRAAGVPPPTPAEHLRSFPRL